MPNVAHRICLVLCKWN